MWCIVLLAPLLTGVGFYLYGVKGLAASAAGAVIAYVNLWAVARVVRGMVEDTRLRSRWLLLAFLKMGALIGVVFTLVASGLPVLAIAVGYAALPIGILIGQLWAPAPADDDPATHKG
jgi:hypothetical protein